MILVLGIVLLLLTFIQSVLVLISDKNTYSKSLSILYFVALIIGIIVLYKDDSEKNIINEYINNTNKKVENLNKLVDSQFILLNNNLHNSNRILNKSDSLNNIIVALSGNQEDIINQYRRINKKLSDEIYLDNMKIQERSAILENFTNTVSWDTTNRNTSVLEVCLTNIGLRSGIIIKGKGYVLFFKDKKIKGRLPIPGYSLEQKIPPNESACYFSHGLKNYSEIFNSVDYAIIMLEVKYRDYLIPKYNISKSYTIWIPDQGFSGPKDWQVNLAKNWEKSNYSF